MKKEKIKPTELTADQKKAARAQVLKAMKNKEKT